MTAARRRGRRRRTRCASSWRCRGSPRCGRCPRRRARRESRRSHREEGTRAPEPRTSTGPGPDFARTPRPERPAGPVRTPRRCAGVPGSPDRPRPGSGPAAWRILAASRGRPRPAPAATSPATRWRACRPPAVRAGSRGLYLNSEVYSPDCTRLCRSVVVRASPSAMGRSTRAKARSLSPAWWGKAAAV